VYSSFERCCYFAAGAYQPSVPATKAEEMVDCIFYYVTRCTPLVKNTGAGEDWSGEQQRLKKTAYIF
jgi:hypothetical protein